MSLKIKKQILKTARYKLQITKVDLIQEDEEPIKCVFKSTFVMQVGKEKIIKEVSNTVFINSDEPIYREIILHSNHIIVI